MAINVELYEISEVEDSLFKYAVIPARYQGKWVFCRHRERATWEVPGGRREAGESIMNTARRELWEETGALEFELKPICAYSAGESSKGWGILCYADIKEMGPLPELEIEEIQLTEGFFPGEPTYPDIQPILLSKVMPVLRAVDNEEGIVNS